MNNHSTSAALSSVFHKGKHEDEDLYTHLPETDKQILMAYLEGSDENNKPYFSRNEKTSFLKKWKDKHLEETLVHETLPVFSTSGLQDKNPQMIELRRLLTLIKDPADRKRWIEQIRNKPVDKAIELVSGYVQMMSESSNLKEETFVLDLNNKTLNESFLRMFGYAIESILSRMFGGSSLPVKIKGTKQQVNTFAHTIAGEKKYMDALQQYGLDSPHTYKTKSALEQAIKKFERTTGIKWPFTDKK